MKAYKDEKVKDKIKMLELERRIKDKDYEIESLKAENEKLQNELATKKEESDQTDTKKMKGIVEEFSNAETYLNELEDEFNGGMKKIYEKDIAFKELGDHS